MAIAKIVQTGSADTGIGILSAAKSLNLDFVEIGYEDYDFLIPFDFLRCKKIIEFIDVLKSNAFKNRILDIGGYEFSKTGEIIEIGDT